jgi:hypothetical protein
VIPVVDLGMQDHGARRGIGGMIDRWGVGHLQSDDETWMM